MNKATLKFNNGNGALLCSGCRVILKEMLAVDENRELEEQYCDECINTNLSEQEWVELITEKCAQLGAQYNDGKHLQVGQAYMKALFKVNKRLYEIISGTNNDCFHDDSKIINFIRFCNK